MQLTRFAMIAALSAIASACETPRLALPEIASARSQTSLCLTMSKLPLRPAATRRDDPRRAAVIDQDNVADSDETVDWGLEHNAKLDAACPSSGAR